MSLNHSMYFFVLLLFILGEGQRLMTTAGLFGFAAGLVAFFFIVVAVLIFIFIYDNLRRERKTTAATT